MPGQNYRSVSINDELIEHVKQLIQQIGTYHSVSEFVSEAVRLRIEILEKTVRTQEIAEATLSANNRKTSLKLRGEKAHV